MSRTADTEYDTGRQTLLVRVTKRGQVTIPKQLRDELGIVAGITVTFERAGDTVVIRKSHDPRGCAVVDRLRGLGDVNMTTDEILALTRGE